MRDSSETAVNILNDLLLYEKIESNLLTIESTRVGLHNVLSDVVNMFKIQVKFPWIWAYFRIKFGLVAVIAYNKYAAFI